MWRIRLHTTRLLHLFRRQSHCGGGLLRLHCSGCIRTARRRLHCSGCRNKQTMPRRRTSRAVGILLLAAQAAALPKWLRWPGKTKEQKAVERVLNEFERDEFYGCIGAKPSANAAALKKAYRATAKLCHPDKNGDSRAPSAFDAARDAYDVLSDPDARREYDRRRQARLREEKKHPTKKMRVEPSGPLGKAWRYRVWVFMSWVLVKTLLA